MILKSLFFPCPQQKFWLKATSHERKDIFSILVETTVFFRVILNIMIRYCYQRFKCSFYRIQSNTYNKYRADFLYDDTEGTCNKESLCKVDGVDWDKNYNLCTNVERKNNYKFILYEFVNNSVLQRFDKKRAS